MAHKVDGSRVPVSIVTGFLGSGKTTLIASLLRQPAMHGTAVIVNELGEVGIDDAIVADADDKASVLLLKNGCLCCTAGDDLLRTLWTLVAHSSHAPREILIETSGAADPVPLLQRLMGDPRLRDVIRLDAVVATVDAVNGLANLDDQPVAGRQAAVADRRLITKSDLAGQHQVDALTRRLLALNPGSDVRVVDHGAILSSELLGVSLYDPVRRRAQVERWLDLERYRANMAATHSHAHGIDGHGTDRHGTIQVSAAAAHNQHARTWLIEQDGPLDWEVLSPCVGKIIASHGNALLRVKGVIWTVGDTRPLIIHGVQRLFHSPVRIERWPAQPRTSLVIIGDDGVGAETAVELLREAMRAAASPSLGALAAE
jgi:G3E family GTPase